MEGGGEVDFERLYQRLAAAEQALVDAAQAGDQRREQILRARGEALAKSRADEEHISLTVMAFQLGGARYGVPFVNLDQIVECDRLCPLQGAPRAVLGAMAVRSGIVPVLDLRVVLGLASGPLSDLRFVLVVSAGPERFGLAVEETHGALGFQARQLRAPPGAPFSALSLEGLLVIDVARLVVPP
jgi:purine-binding chemotaxis protein CheW